MKQENFREVDSLLQKILKGEATSEEINHFSEWVKDFQNEQYFDKFKDMWHVAADYQFQKNVNESGETKRFISYIKLSKRQYRNRRRYIFASAAASVIILFTVSYLTGLVDFRPAVNTDFATLNYSQDSVRVELNNGRVVKNLKAADKSITTIDNESIAQVVESSKEGAVKYNAISTPAGERVTMVLSDGSKVYLTANSYLRYPSSFEKDKREVTVSGRAYFEVKKSTVPFIVNTTDMKIEVLGTSFDVESKATGDDASVILVEGSVKVSAEGKTTIIHPDEQMNLSRLSRTMTVKPVDSKLLTMWKDGVLIVHGQTFSGLIESISSWYGVQIIDRTGVSKSDKFNGRFDREDIEAAIKAVCISAGTKYKIEEGKLILEDL
jgi:ferric-dicitrate binding protein FerR (iron transport regulator)